MDILSLQWGAVAKMSIQWIIGALGMSHLAFNYRLR